jgi:hypothetical protein
MNGQSRLAQIGRHAIPIVLALIVLGVTLARQWQIAGDLTSVPLDDAYIHYRFAHNLAHGRGFAFNPGEPTPGSTSPLWVVLLAVGELAGFDPILTSKVLGALAFVTCAWLTWLLARDLTGSALLAGLTGVLVALSGRLAWSALSGMETAAFAALTLLAIYRLLDRPLDAPVSVLLGLAALLRPEGYLLFALLVLNELPSAIRSKTGAAGDRRSAIIRLLSGVLTFGLVIAPYIVFSLATTGSPLPNTFRANAREMPTLQYLARYVVDYVARDNALAVLFIFCAPIAWRDRRARPAVLWAICFPLVAALLTPNLRHHGRYTMPLIPFNTLLGVVFVRELLREKLPHISRAPLARLVSTIVVVVVLVSGCVTVWRWSDIYAADARDISQLHVKMGNWVAANTPADAQLALSDIGAITVVSNRRVLDIVGLVTPDILPLVSGKPVGLERDQIVFDYLLRHRPDFVVIIPTWYPYLASSPGSRWVELHTVSLDHTPSVGGGDHLRAYRTDWSWFDRQSPENPRAASLGNTIELAGFDLRPGAQAKAGSSLAVTLYWRSAPPLKEGAQPAGRYKVFVHLVDASGKLVTQHDGEPVGNLWPTHLWRPGDAIRDEHVLALPADLQPGTYTVQAGMYDSKTAVRLPVAFGGDAVVLIQINVSSGN